LLAALLLGSPLLAHAEQGAPIGVFIVSDPSRPAEAAVESETSHLLQELRTEQHIDPLRLPIQTYHANNRASDALVHARMAVEHTDLPFVGLARVDADGLPTSFVVRYAHVTDADTTTRALFSHALDLLAQMGVVNRLTEPPAPVGPVPPATDAAAAWYPPGAAQEIRSEPDDADMVLIPGGPFTMGTTEVEDEQPQRTVNAAPFYLDRYEVSNRQFARFVAATHYRTDAEQRGWSLVFKGGAAVTQNGADWQHPAGPGSSAASYLDCPVVHVSWNDARAYCVWASKRLPTEVEWEKAARGVDGRTYPWGNDADEGRSNSRTLQRGDVLQRAQFLDYTHGPVAVGSLPDGASPYGIMDMLGNAAEWVQDWYHPYPGSTHTVNPGEEQEKVLRGGGWEDEQLWAGWRAHAWPETSSSETGFRTCRDVVVTVAPPPAP
jgi:formylglycine-generating enzyme required for sulfatase activity